MSEELKPCPFCGCSDVEYFHGWGWGSREKDSSTGRQPSVSCDGCKVGVMRAAFYGRGISDEEAKADTLERWNTRSFIMAPLKELEGTHPVILYFGTDEDREGFIEVCKEAMPNATAVKL